MFLFYLVNAMEKSPAETKNNQMSDIELEKEIKEKLSLEENKIDINKHISHSTVKSKISIRDPKIATELRNIIDKYALLNISADKKNQERSSKGLYKIDFILTNYNNAQALPIALKILSEEQNIVEDDHKSVYIDSKDINKFNDTLIKNTSYTCNYDQLDLNLNHIQNPLEIIKILTSKYYKILEKMSSVFFTGNILYKQVASDNTDLFNKYKMQYTLGTISIIHKEAEKIFKQKNLHLFTTKIYSLLKDIHKYCSILLDHILTTWYIETEEVKYQKHYVKPISKDDIYEISNMIFEMNKYISSIIEDIEKKDNDILHKPLLTISDYILSSNIICTQMKITLENVLSDIDLKQSNIKEELVKLWQHIELQNKSYEQLLQNMDIIMQNQKTKEQIDQEQNTKIAQSEKERLELKKDIQNNIEESKKSDQEIINQIKQTNDSIIKKIEDAEQQEEEKFKQYNQKINDINQMQNNIAKQTTAQEQLLKQNQLEQKKIKEDIKNQNIVKNIIVPVKTSNINTNVNQNNEIKNTINNPINEQVTEKENTGIIDRVKNTLSNIGTSITNTASKIWDYIT